MPQCFPTRFVRASTSIIHIPSLSRPPYTHNRAHKKRRDKSFTFSPRHQMKPSRQRPKNNARVSEWAPGDKEMSSSLLVFLALEFATLAGGSWDDDPPAAASSLESLVPTWCALGWKRVAVVAPPPDGGGKGPYSKTEVFFHSIFKKYKIS